MGKDQFTEAEPKLFINFYANIISKDNIVSDNKSVVFLLFCLFAAWTSSIRTFLGLIMRQFSILAFLA